MVSAFVTVDRTPFDATLSARVAGGDGAVALVRVTVSERIRRPASEAEIAELPPFPPSIREKARREGIEEFVEAASAAEGEPVSAAAGSTVHIALELSAPPQRVDPVSTAMVVIDGFGAPSLEVPIVVMTGMGAAVAVVTPSELSRMAEPGEINRAGVVVERAPASAVVVAHVPDGGSFMRVEHISARRPIQRWFTPEELEELPPWPPSIREDAERDGYIEHQEVGRATEGMPLTVEWGHQLYISVEFSAPTTDIPDRVISTLFIEATTWRRVDVPLGLTIGKIDAALSTVTQSVRQGETAPLGVTLTSVAGGGTQVALALGMGSDQWWVEPSTVFVARGAAVHADLTVHVDPRAPTGTYPVGFETTAFGGRSYRSIPFELTVRPAVVTARLLQTTIAGAPGSRATCHVEVSSRGGYNVITLTPSAPPGGVAMAPVTVELNYGASTMVIPVELVIDPLAPLVRGDTMGIRWSDATGANQGVLFASMDIAWPPEDRTFHQQITTPTGTALGGWMELTIRSDGTSTFRGHMHGSGLDPYAFRVSVLMRSASGGMCLAALKSGRVGGAIDPTPRDFDWHENSTEPNRLISAFWADLRNGTAEWGKWYEDTGALGTLEDIALAVAEFFAAAVVVGPWVAAAVVVGSELGVLSDIPFLHPTVVAGVFVAGAAILILGPGALIPAVVAGVAAATQVKARRLRDSEEAEAIKVFGDTLPFDRILVTNFDRGARAFCVPNLDGSILVAIGDDKYDNPLSRPEWARTFIHELTHAWQIEHMAIVAELAFEAAINEIKGQAATYSDDPLNVDGRPWGDYSLERQAQIVEGWYELAARSRAVAHPTDSMSHPLDSPDTIVVPAFRYIHENIRMGQT